MLYKMLLDFMWATEVHRFGLEMFGLWPKNVTFSIKSFWSQVHAGIILILLVFVNNVPIIYTIMEDWGDMVLVIGTLRFALPFVLVPVKYAIMRWKRTVLLSIVNMMEEDWVALKSVAERAVMIRRARTARLIMIIGYVFFGSALLITTVPTYFDVRVVHVTNFTKQTKLPFETYQFYNIHKSPQLELTLFLQNITSFLAAATYLTIDFFLLLVIFHFCGQLENFRNRLISLVSCQSFGKILHDIVVYHLRLIKFANHIENTYTLMMLIIIFHFVVVFCFSGFIMTIIFKKGEMNKDIVMEICFVIYILISLLMNTFVYCGAGEMVVEQSNAVYRAICDLEWYKLESQKARNLILLMIRTNHPFHITAGKIIPLTIATFCSILKTSCGYISFLLAKR
ncbi:PREDICTED: odorant receptor 85b-like isoform X6 [Vollenhovia emeryi]|uniref:odorant receptor 85b-like isoform X6 n=1 Tax=Vollenhovia emeryi TaxID=411798 RepID=UPI0005F584FE|nr:PREDICTED: odorant receptor 85b-like isoform X6 [Vollenhovia emeryi]